MSAPVHEFCRQRTIPGHRRLRHCSTRRPARPTAPQESGHRACSPNPNAPARRQPTRSSSPLHGQRVVRPVMEPQGLGDPRVLPSPGNGRTSAFCDALPLGTRVALRPKKNGTPATLQRLFGCEAAFIGLDRCPRSVLEVHCSFGRGIRDREPSQRTAGSWVAHTRTQRCSRSTSTRLAPRRAYRCVTRPPFEPRSHDKLLRWRGCSLHSSWRPQQRPQLRQQRQARSQPPMLAACCASLLSVTLAPWML